MDSNKNIELLKSVFIFSGFQRILAERFLRLLLNHSDFLMQLVLVSIQISELFEISLE